MAVTVQRRRRVWIVVVAVVVLAVAATVFATARSSAAPEYRTAKAATGDVKVTLDVTGTIQPVDRADLSFPVAGVVTAVPVALGQHVTAGTVLAQLDTTALDAQVASAASQLAAAKAKLAADRSGQGSAGGAANAALAGAPQGSGALADVGRGGSAAANAPSGTAAAAGAGPGSAGLASAPAGDAGSAAAPVAMAGAGPASAGQANPAADDDAVRGGPAAPATAAAAPAAAGTRPADAGPAGGTPAGAANAAADDAGRRGPAASGTAAPPVAPAGTVPAKAAQQALQQATDALAKAREAREAHQQAAEAALATVQHDLDAAGPACEPAGDAAACQVALKKVLDGQTEVATLQKQVAADNKALDAGIAVLLQAAAKLASAATAIPTVPPAAAAPPAAAPPAAASPPTARAAAPPARAASAVSAEQLAADQAAIDAAAAQLTTAQQNRDQSKITSPFDGTVGALNLQHGQRVSGAGSAQVVVVGAARGFQVQATVGEGDVARLAGGNAVTVTPDGAAAPLTGTVSSIGILPTATTAGAVNYPVTIALPAGSGPFPAGQGASVAIQVADVAGVLTVPTSAVHTTGANRTVEVVRGGRAAPVEVQVGAVGAARTEITAGLAAGDEVVLADPSRPLPTTGFSGLSRIGGR